MSRDRASEAQIHAADPGASTWLSANAGSGKTRVLTDRVARLLLNRVRPQNILCLTYTKAAASEMQNRLFQRLGDWALKPDAELSAALKELGADGSRDRDQLAKARRLFARAIDTPGGLRIQTIHSFCASLLRRFPLEARVSPQFMEMDDRAAALLREDVVEELARGGDAGAVTAMAEAYNGEDFGQLTAGLVRRRNELLGPVNADDILGWFGLSPGTDFAEVLASVTDGSEAALMQRMLPILAGLTDAYVFLGKRLSRIDWSDLNKDDYQFLCEKFLFSGGGHRPKVGEYPSLSHKAARKALAPVLGDLDRLIERTGAAKQKELALLTAQRTQALYWFARAFLPAYEARKQALGRLDFDDLILKTCSLLTNSEVAEWVLYRLDGGIDHILVDEAQDTNPTQWQVIEALAQEFTAGQGARDGVRRTIFVVGDPKQSIYSFQGADPAEFDRMRGRFRHKVQATGESVQELDLEYSFRSSQAVLRLVDLVFEPFAGKFSASNRRTRHAAFHDELPGRVDLWPVVEKSDEKEDKEWFDPIDQLAPNHHISILAREIAGNITTIIESETLPEADGTRRAVRAGDIMVLVQRRSEVFHEIIRACKAAGLPIAGADRLKLGGELAVRDLGALLSFLATPEDDLSLASALRSPLFGWSEDALFRLAHGRGKKYLWQALRGQTNIHRDTIGLLFDLLEEADFLRPYDLIERILTRHDGRRRLLARLGHEAQDGIDLLLSQALAYERMEVPSLTGFLTWLDTDEVEIKRQMDSAGDRIRVMTVHGAKGLEAPIVILPDCAKRDIRLRDEMMTLETGQPVWRPTAEFQPNLLNEALNRQKEAEAQERQRILYVAMTRAEKWLIVCAAGKIGKPGDSWYSLVSEGMQRAGGVRHEFGLGEGLRLTHGDWSAGTLQSGGAEVSAEDSSATVPPWAKTPARVAAQSPPPRAPSDLGGEKTLPGEAAGTGQDTALLHGTLIHLLLEHLPEIAPAARQTYAGNLLATMPENPVDTETAAVLTEHAIRVLNAPELRHLFGSDALAEVEISAKLDVLGGARIHGAIDRLIVTPSRVMAVDFKSNAVVPETPNNIPEGLLRQVGAYDAALRQIYPNRAIEVAILWTTVPTLMVPGHDIVSAALRRAATS